MLKSHANRPPKNAVDPQRPYAFLVELERTAAGLVENVATIFLTNRECPFHCLMCDLWKNTTDQTVPLGAIPAQIDFALEQLPEAKHIKLYNSGNFFDVKAIPQADHAAIAERVKPFQTVIVENHPKFCGEVCVVFRDLIETPLEIAIGLETIHPEVLPQLNKQMTVGDFDRSVAFLTRHDISVRTFILFGLPFLEARESEFWAIRSVQHAFEAGAGCCSIIPTRTGNGVMDQLEQQGQFYSPDPVALERTFDAALQLEAGRVFVDLWDAERWFSCPRCGPMRIERLKQMNYTQQITPEIACTCRATP